MGNGRIAFVAEKHESQDETEPGFERIYTVGPDGAGLEILREARQSACCYDHYDALSWAPDGRRLTVIGQAGGGGRPHFTVDLHGGDREALPLDPDLTLQAAWAPDGKLLAYTTGDELRVLDTQTQDDRVVWAGGDGPARASVFGRLGWTTHGELVALTERRGRGQPSVMRLINVTNGETRTLLRRPEGMSDALLSPDAHAVAVLPDSRAECSNELTVVDLRTGRSRLVTRECVAPGSFDWSPDSAYLGFVNFAADSTDEAILWSVPAKGGAATALLTAESIGADRLYQVAWQPTKPQ